MIRWRDEGSPIRQGVNITASQLRLGQAIGIYVRVGPYCISKRWRSWTADIPWSISKQ